MDRSIDLSIDLISETTVEHFSFRARDRGARAKRARRRRPFFLFIHDFVVVAVRERYFYSCAPAARYCQRAATQHQHPQASPFIYGRASKTHTTRYERERRQRLRLRMRDRETERRR